MLCQILTKSIRVDKQKSPEFKGRFLVLSQVLLIHTMFETKKNKDLLALPPKTRGHTPHHKTVCLSAIRENNYPREVGFRDYMLLL